MAGFGSPFDPGEPVAEQPELAEPIQDKQAAVNGMGKFIDRLTEPVTTEGPRSYLIDFGTEGRCRVVHVFAAALA
jgi:hypothetical protein